MRAPRARAARLNMPRIDAHHHFWRVARGDYHWMPTSGPLHRDHLPADLQPHLRTAHIDGTVLVQAAQTVAETDFLRKLADEPDSPVLGIVGWAPLDSPDAPNTLDRLATDERVVAIRPMLQDLADADWVTRPTVVENLRRLPALGLAFEVLSYPQHLPYALAAIDQVPDLAVVIDHLSKPTYRPQPTDGWRHWMAEFARRPQVHCKLSGMVTEVTGDWSADDFRAHADLVLDLFGAERVMFGSDWPVCLQAASYGEVVGLAEDLLADLSDHERAHVWGATAARFYGLADVPTLHAT